MTQDEYLAPFVAAYCEAMLWANTTITRDGAPTDDSVDPSWWQTPGAGWQLEAFDTTSRAEITAECEGFVTAQWSDLRDLDPAQCGHDFALTRNHHGAGFWDRGLGDVGDRLTAAAHAYGSSDAFVDVDGTEVTVS